MSNNVQKKHDHDIAKEVTKLTSLQIFSSLNTGIKSISDALVDIQTSLTRQPDNLLLARLSMLR